MTQEELDICVDDLLDAILETTKAAKGHSSEFDISGHHALARRAASECAVLLKNDNDILPLGVGTKVAVIGDFAFVPRYQGAGSSVVNTTKLESFNDIAANETALIGVGSLGQEDPLEEGTVNPLPRTEELGGLQSMGHKELDRTEASYAGEEKTCQQMRKVPPNSKRNLG